MGWWDGGWGGDVVQSLQPVFSLGLSSGLLCRSGEETPSHPPGVLVSGLIVKLTQDR